MSEYKTKYSLGDWVYYIFRNSAGHLKTGESRVEGITIHHCLYEQTKISYSVSDVWKRTVSEDKIFSSKERADRELEKRKKEEKKERKERQRKEYENAKFLVEQYETKEAHQ